MSKKIGTFKLGGVSWKIIIDNNTCETNESSWVRWLNKQTIGIRDTYSILLNYDVLERNIWDAIFFIIVNDHMEYRGFTPKQTFGITGLLYQALTTNTCRPGEWDGTFQLGGINYIVKVDNKSGADNQFFGRCNPNSKLIEITTQNYAGVESTDDFIYQTLIHEILHAINYELGFDEAKTNSEKFVNTTATFIYEVYKTLKINFPDESD